MDKLMHILKKPLPDLMEVLKDVENRYIAVENKAPEPDKRNQRQEIINMLQVITHLSYFLFMLKPHKICH